MLVFIMDDNGIITKKSSHSVDETVNKLENVLQSKGIQIFGTIDQQEEAAKVGLFMRPTVLVLFGDPKAGTPLMNDYPSLAIDLPLKALVWKDGKGNVWISYNSPEYLQKRHGLKELPFTTLPSLIDTVLQ